jgi:hypothetical protein
MKWIILFLLLTTFSFTYSQSYRYKNNYHRNQYRNNGRYSYQKKNTHLSFLLGTGINSYHVLRGTSNLSFPYLQCDLQSGITSTQRFEASHSFVPRRILPEIIFGFDLAGRRLYSDCHLSFGIGRYSQSNLAIGAGFVIPLQDKRFSLRIGTDYFASYGHADVGKIDNNQKDIYINGEEYMHNYHIHGRHTTTYYNSTAINVSVRETTIGFRPKISLVFQPEGRSIFYKFNLGYGIPIATKESIGFKQTGKTTTKVNYNDHEDETESANNPYYNYSFNGSRNQGPFLGKGIFFSIELGFKF